MTVDLQPSASERARTVLCQAGTMAIEIGAEVIETVDLTGVDADGSLVVLVGMNSPLVDRVADHFVPCRLQAALVSPLPGADRVLDRVSAIGHLVLETDVSTGMQVVLAGRRGDPATRLPDSDGAVLLRVVFTALNLNGCPVSPTAYAAAQADPLAAGSNAFVEHLGRGHAAEVIQLAHLLDPELTQDVRAVTPVRVDRYGLTLRLDHGAGAARTARLNFDTALRDPRELPRAMQVLQHRAARVRTCPFTNPPQNPC